MTLYALKPRFQGLLRPLVARLASGGVTANQVTLLAAAGSLVIAALVVWKAEHRILFLLLPVWFLVRMALNAIDGMLAREFGQKSRVGAYLNELCDVVSDAALYLPFAFVAPFSSLGVGVAVFLSALTEFAGILGPTVEASRRYDGPLGKSDRALTFGALGLWVGVGAPLPDWMSWFFPLINVFLIITVVNRVRAGLREAASAG
jgi:CDP-diacylglycerol---glycerol-3-phosphate 3-phosphatidyltransferase